MLGSGVTGDRLIISLRRWVEADDGVMRDVMAVVADVGRICLPIGGTLLDIA
jgi:hypothetical protein